MKKLTIKDLAGYLPYGFKMINTKSGRVITLVGAFMESGNLYVIDGSEGNHYGLSIWPFKPLLRPLSSLTKPITVEGYNGGEPFVPSKKLTEQYLHTSYWGENEIGIGILDKQGKMVNLCFIANEIVGECPFMIYENLIKWHFDLDGLIDQNLALPIED